MPTEKVSISLPAKTLKFVDAYRKIHSLKTRSDVIEAALAMLRETEREAEISEAPAVEDDVAGLDLHIRDRGDDETP
jgi:metal-responsive CopG/Arc/MetJ family transcriptional regulator